MNKNQVKGFASTVKGKTKEIIGVAVGNNDLKYKGKAKKVSGKIESAYGDAKDNFEKSKE